MYESEKSIEKPNNFHEFLTKEGINKIPAKDSNLGTSNRSRNERKSQILQKQHQYLNSNHRSDVFNDRQHKYNGSRFSQQEDRESSPIEKLDSKLLEQHNIAQMNKLRVSSTNKWQGNTKLINSVNLDRQQNQAMNSSMYFLQPPKGSQINTQDIKQPKNININSSKISSQDNLPYLINTIPKYESKKILEQEEQYFASKIDHDSLTYFRKTIVEDLKYQLRNIFRQMQGTTTKNIQDDLIIIKEEINEIRRELNVIRKYQDDHHSTQQHTNAQINRIYNEINELALSKNQQIVSQQTVIKPKCLQSLEQKYFALQSQKQKLKEQVDKLLNKNKQLKTQQKQQREILVKQSEYYKNKYKTQYQSRCKKQEQLLQYTKNICEDKRASFKCDQTKLSMSINSIYIRPLLQSNILSRYQGEGDTFLKSKIQQFNERKVKRTELLFQKDKFNGNIGNYLVQYPFPLILLMQSQKGQFFGFFGQGIESQFTEKLKEKNVQISKFQAFLFNLNRQQIFTNQHKTTSISAMYSENCLQIGNNQIILKNRELDRVKVNIANILGQVYFTIKHRQSFIEQQETIVPLKALQLHKIFF